MSEVWMRDPMPEDWAERYAWGSAGRPCRLCGAWVDMYAMPTHDKWHADLEAK